MLEAVPGQSLHRFVGTCKPGDVVGLPPGEYGGFWIDRATHLTFRGLGRNPAEVQVLGPCSGPSAALLVPAVHMDSWVAAHLRLENLTIRNRSGWGIHAWGKEQSLELENCTIADTANFGIWLRGRASARLLHCSIGPAGELGGAGIVCDQESAVALEGCQVAGWSGNAIQLAGKARLTCCKSVLAKCGGSGLLVTGPGTSADVRRSRILGNGRFGVEIVPPRRTLRMRLAGVFAREKRQASPWPGISGAGNTIPDQGEADGNALGVLSPVDGPWPDGFY